MTGEFLRGVLMAASVLAAGASLALAAASGRRAATLRARVSVLLALERRPRRGRPRPKAWVRRWGPPLGAVITSWVLLGGAVGWMVGMAGAYGVRRWLRRRSAGSRGGGEQAVRQLPLAADLLAACIAAGAGPREAAEAVGESLGGPVGEQLARTAAELRLGGEPAEAWGRLGAIPGAAGLARCLERAGATGAPAAEPVARLAEGFRAERSRGAVARGHRAQVLITAPVGLCFLPAFLAVGVAPVVIGLAGGLLKGS